MPSNHYNRFASTISPPKDSLNSEQLWHLAHLWLGELTTSKYQYTDYAICVELGNNQNHPHLHMCVELTSAKKPAHYHDKLESFLLPFMPPNFNVHVGYRNGRKTARNPLHFVQQYMQKEHSKMYYKSTFKLEGLQQIEDHQTERSQLSFKMSQQLRVNDSNIIILLSQFFEEIKPSKNAVTSNDTNKHSINSFVKWLAFKNYNYVWIARNPSVIKKISDFLLTGQTAWLDEASCY